MYIIVLAGMPASGKTTVAKALSKAFALPVLEKDALKEAIICFASKTNTISFLIILNCFQSLGRAKGKGLAEKANPLNDKL